MYNSIDLLSILSEVLGSYKQFSNGEYYFHCPFCNHYKPKLAINVVKGKWHCWKCNASGNKIITLFRRLNVSQYHIDQLKGLLGHEIKTLKSTGDNSVSALLLPQEYIPIWTPSKSIERKHAISYLISRNISAIEMIKYQIGYCVDGIYKNRIIIPSFDENNKLNFFVGRDFFNTSHLPYLIPPVSKNIIGFDSYINWDYPIILCEGVFDAIAIKWNAIPLFGKTIPKKLISKIIDKKTSDVFLSLDSDALQNSIQIIELLMSVGCRVHYVQLNEKDPSIVGFKKMFEKINETQSLDFKDVLKLKLELNKM